MPEVGQEFPTNLKKCQVNGEVLHFWTEGSGDPVVFVHGDLSDLRTWNRQIPEFSKNYRAISISRRYARPNLDIIPDVPNPIGRHVEDLIEFIKQEVGRSVHLVGNSWGAFVSLLTAVESPDLVRSLVLEEPPAVPVYINMPPRVREIALLLTRPLVLASLVGFNKNLVKPVAKLFMEERDEEAMKKFFHGVVDDFAFDALPKERIPQMRENVSALKAGLFGAGFPQLDVSLLRSLQIPTLLLVGEHSAPILHKLAERVSELLPDSRIVEILDASHVMHEENSEEVNARIQEFISKY